jgi:hypothetical protein
MLLTVYHLLDERHRARKRAQKNEEKLAKNYKDKDIEKVMLQECFCRAGLAIFGILSMSLYSRVAITMGHVSLKLLFMNIVSSIQCQCNVNSMSMQCQFKNVNGMSILCQWNVNSMSMEFQWNVNSMSLH